MPSSVFWILWEDNRGRRTDNMAGRHPIWTISAPTSVIPIIFTSGALLVATLPIYRGLGQAPSMVDCTPSGLFYTRQHCSQLKH